MGRPTTARAEIRLAGPDATYNPITFTPVVSKYGHELSLSELRIRRRDERFTLDTLPLALALPQAVGKDVVYWTMEADGTEGDDRKESFELQMIIPESGERTTLELRAVLDDEIPDMLFYEYRDETGTWQSILDVLLRDVLDEAFVHSFEAAVLEALQTNELEALPGLFEDC